MANSTMKIDLIFQANTQAALNNIQQLNNLLNQISTTTTIGINKGSIDQAVQSAQQLQGALAQATSVDTGKIDLTKLNNSLKQSGTNLKTLSNNLLALGPQGEQAFVKLANAIGRAETPMFQLNEKLKNFGTTLLNTVKWQVASNMIHGIQGAIQGAIAHAEKLNGALNDIRIVTGKSIDEMSKFADVARKAAKEINSTTTEYSKAALIFYQQGLDGDAVTDRAEVVLKLAQVTGENAEKISDQMTAVWNNFYNGSKSLEYYADVLTKLGAETASSSDEIIQGLEKFAATADTIGLSYEYAAASLATVVAETRQAPEVVGNAFKTLFARLQGLSLGETLEDGTDLTKYSKALQAVGVQIKDQSGELKNADIILTETAEAWDKLGKSEQVALAQTVGGMRQYSQFIALMDNWDKVEMNVDVAKMSEGELTAQQKIWSESWEAADKRVEQSKNELYEQIIDDKVMIGLKDIWSDIIDSVGTFIDKMGGIVPVIGMLVGVFSKQLFPIISNGFTRLKNNLEVLTGVAAKKVLKMQDDVRSDIEVAVSSNLYSDATKNQLLISDKLIQARQQLTLSAKNMSIAEREAAERKMAIIEQTANEIQKSLELQAEWEKEIALLEKKTTQGTYKQEAAKNIIEQSSVDKTDDDFQEEYGMSKDQMAEKAAKGPSAKSRIKYYENTLTDLDKQIETKNEEIKKQHENEKFPMKPLSERQLEATKELREAREKLNEEYNKEKKSLERISEIQAIIAKNQPKDLSVGKTTNAGFTIDNDPDNLGVNKDTYQYIKNMQEAMAEKMGEKNPVALEGQNAEGIITDASLGNLEKAYQLQGEYSSAAQKSIKVQEDLGNATNKANDQIKKMNKEYKDVSEAIKRYNTLNKKKAKTSKEAKEFQQLSQELQKLTQSYKNSYNVMMSFAEIVNLNEDEVNQLKASFAKLDNLETAEKGMEEINIVLRNLVPAFQNAENGAEELALALYDTLQGKNINPEQLEALRKKYEDLGREAAKTKGNIDGFNETINQGLTGPQVFAQKLGNITQGITQAVSGIMMLQGAFSTLATAFDKGNTPMENFTNYLMGITTLIPAVTSILQGFSTFKSALTKKELADDKKKQASDLTTSATGAFKGAVQSFGVWGVVIGGVLAAAILAGGILALTVSAPKAKEEQEEENMAGTLSSLKSSLNEATAAAKEFKESVSNYEDGVKGLEELKKGTEEYEKKLEEVNAQAKELISTYGLWDDYKIENGVYKINEEKLDEIEAQKDASVRNLEKTVVAADIGYDIAKYKSSVAQTAADSYWDNAWSGVGGLVVDNVLLPGSGLGSVAAGITSSHRGSSLTAEEIDTIVKAMNDSGRVFDANTMTGDTFIEELSKIDGLASIIEDNKWALKTYSEEIISSAKIQSDYTNSLQQKTEALLALDIEDKYGELIKSSFSSDIDEGTMDAVSKIMAESSEERTNASEVLEKALEDANVGSLSQADRNSLAIAKEQYNGDMDYEELTKEYAKLKGLNDDEIKDLIFEDKDWKGTLKTASGEAPIDQVYYDQMVRELKQAEVTNQITSQLDSADQIDREAQAQALGEMTTTFNNTMDGLGDAILNSMTAGKIDNGNYSLDLTSIFDDLSSQAEVDSLKGLNEYDLIEKLGLTPEKIEQMGFDSAKAFENAFDKGLENWSIYAYEEQVQAEVDSILQTAASEYELDEEVLQAQAKLLQENVEGLEDNAKAAAEMAVLNQRMNKGVDTLTESWEDWKDTLESAEKTSQDYAEALVEVSKAMKDILGLSEDSIIPEDFLASDENLDLLDQIADGSEEAVEELGYNLLKAQIEAQEITQDIHNNIAGILDVEDLSAEDALEQFNILKTSLLNSVDEMQASLDGLNPGAAFEGENAIQFAEALNAYAAATKMTSEQMHEYLSEAGVDAEVTTSVVDTTMKVPETTTEETVVPTGLFTKKIISKVTDTKLVDATGQIEVAQINMGESGKSPKITKLGRGNITSSVTSSSKSSDSSSSSAPEKVDRTKKSEVVNRYEEINNALDDVTDRAERASKAMDRLYGADKLKAMRDQKVALREEIKLLEQKQKENEKYLQQDKQQLEKIASEIGIELQFDKQGNVINYEEAMSSVYEELARRENHMDSLATGEEQDDYEEQYIIPLTDWISDFTENYDTYNDTKEEKEDLAIEIEDLKYEEQDLTAEEFSYKIELRTEIEESELEKLDYYLDKFSNDFYKTAESAALAGDKIKISQSSLHNIGNDIKELDALRANEAISQSFYIESLKDSKEEIYAQLETLQELDDEMMNYYGETLSAANEELSKFTDKLSHTTSVLDHYYSLLELTGQTRNFKAIGKVLEGQAKTLENSYLISKQQYQEFAQEAEEQYQKMNAAIALGNEEEAELYKEKWESAKTAANEAQEEMLSQAEAWASKLKEVLENELSDIAHILEQSLTGGRSFDELSMQMEHAQGIQEEYLTTTNKIYETNKLIRNAQNEIDKTTNTVAKQKLKAFQQETQQLQKQGKLSQFELNIQQKKYDLLLAKIALEEAQNAKSVVTLQRDSEGNFGYIYTANQDQVSNAEQGVEDAENALYNARLEAANNYGSQRLALMQGFNDAMSELNNKYYNEQIISEEEYDRQKSEIQSYYFEKMRQNSELYGISIEEDSSVAAEAWVTNTEIMNTSTEEFEIAVKQYLEDTKLSLDKFDQKIEQIAISTGVNLDILEDNIQDVTDESDELKNKVLDEVIPALQDEIDQVDEVTDEYALHREEILKVIEDYEGLVNYIDTVLLESLGSVGDEFDNIETQATEAMTAIDLLSQKMVNLSSSSSSSLVQDTEDYDYEEEKETNSDVVQSDAKSYKKDELLQERYHDGTNPSEAFKIGASVQGKFKNTSNSSQLYTFYTYDNGVMIKQYGKSFYDFEDTSMGAYTQENINQHIANNMPYLVADRIKVGKDWYYKINHNGQDEASEWIKGSDLVAFDTGGYTGEWGTEGKWALLHQKELVLNDVQTENLLMTMELLDSIIKQIDIMTMNNKVSQIHSDVNSKINSVYKEALKQDIKIEAVFPNATDKNSIYEAFMSLPNEVSQYINR